MYTLVFGLYPLAAIVVCALLTLIYFSVVRLKCSPRWAMGGIFATMMVTTVFSLVSPLRWVELDTTVELSVEPEVTSVPPVSVTGTAGESTPSLKVKARQPLATGNPTIRPFLHNASHLFGWLWLTGCCIMLLHLVWQLSRLFYLRRRLEYVSPVPLSRARLYETDGTEAYSFGRNIFIPRAFDSEMRRFMTLHELAHVEHHHFLWLCAFQVLLAVNWYNPFCWLLLREMRLQQELQVDGDVLRQGVDRTAYQYALLRASMQNGSPVWILSAFGRKPITHRVAFMNSDINARSNVRRAVTALLLAFMVLSLTVVVACQNNEKLKEHPLMGWWKMDFTKNTDSDTEMYPFGRQIAFYNYDTFLTISYRTREGKTLAFSFSAEETRLKGDTLVDALGEPMRYEFISDDTFQNQWHKQPYQNAMPKGPEITDQWSRMAVDEELLELFQSLYHADEARSGKFDGVWQYENPEKVHQYLVVNADMALLLFFHRQEPRAYRAAGHGYCGRFQDLVDFLQLGYERPVQYSLPEADHLIIRDDTGEKTYRRIPMPTDLKRMFSAPLTHEHCDYHPQDAERSEKQSEEPVFDIAEHMPEFSDSRC